MAARVRSAHAVENLECFSGKSGPRAKAIREAAIYYLIR